MPLDINFVTPDVSFNRIVIMHAPDLPESLKGKTSYKLFSRKWLLQAISDHMPELMTLPDPIPAFDDLFSQQDPSAMALAQMFEKRLFWVIHTLKYPHPANREARPTWDESYWDTFANMKHFIFGGGLMRGALGAYMVAYAQERLGDACTINISPYAPILPMLGAARHVPDNTQKALIFDFGETATKCAIATYQQGTLIALHTLSSIPSPEFTGEARPHYVADHIVNVIAQTWHTYADAQTSLVIPASIATYMNGENPFGDNSYGAILQLATADKTTNRVLSEKIVHHIGADVQLMLIHDGVASGRVYAGQANTVVVAIGTAWGVGFPVCDVPLRSVAESLIIKSNID